MQDNANAAVAYNANDHATDVKAQIMAALEEYSEKTASAAAAKVVAKFATGEIKINRDDPAVDSDYPEPVKKMTYKNKVRLGRLGQAFALGRRMSIPASKVYEQLYPRDTEIIEAMRVMSDAASGAMAAKSMTVTDPTAGGFLVPEVIANEIIGPLLAATFLDELGARMLPIPSGNLAIPRVTSSAMFTWIGETKVITKTQLALDSLRLSVRKGGAIVPISNDLLRSTNPGVSAYVADDMIKSVKIGVETAALYGTGSQHQPLGLKAALTAYPNQIKNNPTTKLTDDILISLVGQMLQDNSAVVSPGWIINGYTWAYLMSLKNANGVPLLRDEMNTGSLLGIPYHRTSICQTAGATAANDIFLGDWNEYVVAEQGGVEVAQSDESSFVDENGNQVSLFATDQTAIRALIRTDYGPRQPKSFIAATYRLS